MCKGIVLLDVFREMCDPRFGLGPVLDLVRQSGEGLGDSRPWYEHMFPTEDREVAEWLIAEYVL